MSDLISTRDGVRVLFAALHESGCMNVCGCRPMTTAPRTPGAAFANLQRRKSREGVRRRCGVRYRELSAARNCEFEAKFSKAVGLACVHNFGVMAQVLLTGESSFLSLCDFKELHVTKRTRSTTSA
jgi:hypothetical protein